MRIGIDATHILINKKTGIEKYTTELIHALHQEYKKFSDIEIYLYFHMANPHVNKILYNEYIQNLFGFHIKTYPFKRGYRIYLYISSIIDSLDIFHLTSPYSVGFIKCPIIITLHDTAWVHLPEDGQKIECIHVKKDILKGINQATHVIAVSKSTMRDAVEIFGVNPININVIYHGVDCQFHRKNNNKPSVIYKYGIRKYILYVASLQYRKNHVRLIKAYKLLKEKYNTEHSLLLVGRKGWGYDMIYEEVNQSRLEESIFMLDYVEDVELPNLYLGADLFVYPSLYEGFGLPVLEAMKCGTVVAASNVSSIPEVGGEAVLYFDPYDIENIAFIMNKALTDNDLRQTLREIGYRRVEKFSWENTAGKTLQIYEKVYSHIHENK